jgi:hypothetical protein
MTTIERVHEQLLNHKNAAPRDDDNAVKWIERYDTFEEKIGCLGAESLGDVLIKLDILCDRLEQASVCTGDLVIAKSVREDLKQLSFKYEN